MDYELYHHGIKGQKWGVRRYQNKDGSLTSEGKQRYVKPRHAPSEARKKAIAEEKARIAEQMSSKFQNDAYRVQLEKIEIENELKLYKATK